MGERELPGSGRGGPLPEAAAWNVTAYLLSGLILGGGVGWLLSSWLGSTLFILAGLLAGTALSMYVIWVRYVSR